jgi:hypothetical protein
VKKILLILFVLMTIAGSAFASSSANYKISADNVNLGAASVNSAGYKMQGIIRDTKAEASLDPDHLLGNNFFNVVYGFGPVTFETAAITAITPNSAYNSGSSSVEISGLNISSDATAKLTMAGQPDINGLLTMHFAPASMECTFDLTGARTGSWNVVVTNTGYNKTRTANGAFSVLSSGLSSSQVKITGIPVNDPNPFNPSNGPTTIKYTLNADADIVLYMFNQRGEQMWRRTFGAGQNGGKSGANTVDWDGDSDFSEHMPTGVYVLFIISRSSSRELGRVRIAILSQ